MIVLWIAILIASLFFLIKSSDYFTEYSEKIGVAAGMSSFIVGVTIVAIGTSLPELVSSMFAIQAGESSFVIDNIIGSNIANALLILGVASLVVKKGLKIETSLVDVDLPFFFLSTGLFLYFLLDKFISIPEGIALLIFFVIFFIYNIKSTSDPKDSEEEKDLIKHYKKGNRPKDMVKYFFIVGGSAVVLAFSAKYLVDSVLTLSELLKISSSTLTITIVAFGTSLPEILTSTMAVKRGNHAMAVGNVLGSNTFNVLLVGGIPALFGGLTIAETTNAIGIPFLILATLGAIFILLDNRIRRWEGIAILCLYAIFLAKIIGIM